MWLLLVIMGVYTDGQYGQYITHNKKEFLYNYRTMC